MSYQILSSSSLEVHLEPCSCPPKGTWVNVSIQHLDLVVPKPNLVSLSILFLLPFQSPQRLCTVEEGRWENPASISHCLEASCLGKTNKQTCILDLAWAIEIWLQEAKEIFGAVCYSCQPYQFGLIQRLIWGEFFLLWFKDVLCLLALSLPAHSFSGSLVSN